MPTQILDWSSKESRKTAESGPRRICSHVNAAIGGSSTENTPKAAPSALAASLPPSSTLSGSISLRRFARIRLHFPVVTEEVSRGSYDVPHEISRWVMGESSGESSEISRSKKKREIASRAHSTVGPLTPALQESLPSLLALRTDNIEKYCSREKREVVRRSVLKSHFW